LVFLPDHKTLIWYKDPIEDINEINLTEMYGTLGTHYISRLWNVNEEGHFFGLRLYPNNITPVKMSTKVIGQYIKNIDKPYLNKIGKRTRNVFLMSEDSIKFEKLWLYRDWISQDIVDTLLNMVDYDETK